MEIDMAQIPPATKAFRVVETSPKVLAIVRARVSILALVHFNGLLDLEGMTLHGKGIEALEFVKGTRRIIVSHKVNVLAAIIVLGSVDRTIAFKVNGGLVMGPTIASVGRTVHACILHEMPSWSGQELFGPSRARLQVTTADLVPLLRRPLRIWGRTRAVVIGELIHILSSDVNLGE